MRRATRFNERTLSKVPSPCYIIEEQAIEENCKVLDRVQKKTGCKILLAIKGFALFGQFPTIRRYLQGTCASGLYEARLGKEKFGKELHVYTPAYDDREFSQLLKISDHMVFNSVKQWERFRALVRRSPRKVSCGLRINPEYSEVTTELWNPCARYSRFGVRAEDLKKVPEGIDGLHFHAMCAQEVDTLDRLLAEVERKFGKHLSVVDWVNFGGGNLITAPGYDLDRLSNTVTDFQNEHGVQVYMEPGEAVVLNAGVMASTVLDIVHNERDVAILDISAWAHIPEILAASFKPEILGARDSVGSRHNYRLASRSCLSGDIIGDYSFSRPLQIGSRIVLRDMASYAVVSNNIFNGIPLPSIGIMRKSGKLELVRAPSYKDYESRLS